jgi:hypothetical protein
VRYRYYVSQSAHDRTGNGKGLRIPAREIETATIEALAAAFDDLATAVNDRACRVS